ncbi:MAG: hypothetical protein EXS18_00820 [Verrucomicrobiae bacterium]|nr:hypothetical protein [Verrucomicrobiae bacterium]
MRVLLDECLPRRLRRGLPGHEVKTTVEMGWGGLKNGALLSKAEGAFDVFLTSDQNLEYQQKLQGRKIAVIVLCALTNDVSDLEPLMPKVASLLLTALKGEVTRIS